MLPKTKRLMLINDTGQTSNPGCKMVRKAMDRLFSPQAARSSIADCVPLGYWAQYFKDIAANPRQCIIKNPGYFPVPTENAPSVNFEKWLTITESLIETDLDFLNRIEKCDAVVVNGEGSIHHNFPRALALLALMQACIVLRKPVLLLNTTIQAMELNIIKNVLGSMDLVHARDTRTFNEIQPCACNNVVCSPDIAFLAIDIPNSTKDEVAYSQNVLVTAGVTACAETLEILFNAVFAAGLKPIYFCIGDGGEAVLAKRICEQKNVALINACDIQPDNIVEFLSQFPMAISGRHHMNIFFMCAGVPFVPIPSNTWKIESTLSMVGYPVEAVRNTCDLEIVVKHVWNNRDDLARQCRNCFDEALAMSECLKKRIEQCGY